MIACLSLCRFEKNVEPSRRLPIHKTLKLESDNQKLLDGVQSVLDKKSTDTESLQHEIAKRDPQAGTFE